jgi:hypothetical protein
MEPAARNELLEGDGMAGAAADAGKGELFCTGSGRSVSVSESAIRRARELVGEEVEEASFIKKRSKSLCAQLFVCFGQTVQSSGAVSSSMNWLSFCICCTGLNSFSVSEQPFGDAADVEGGMDGSFGGKTCLHLFLC